MGFQKATVANVWLFLGVTHAHLIMNFPEPYNYHNGSKGLVQVDPLDGRTLPFPCQGRADSFDKRHVLNAGDAQLVNFTGGAQHAGGSCQFSISYEDPLAVDARNWKAIYTLIGGCPLQRKASSGNVDDAQPDVDLRKDGVHCGNDSGFDCIRQFDVPIPKGLKNGNATFAWTWFNNLGNREMYMNCAPVEIKGGSDNDSYFNSLPQLFVANIRGQDVPGVPSPKETGMCLMWEQGIVNFPNPGKHGRILETPTKLTTSTNGECTLATTLPSFVEDFATATRPGTPVLTGPHRNSTSAARPTATGHGTVASSLTHKNITIKTKLAATGFSRLPISTSHRNSTQKAKPTATGHECVVPTFTHGNVTLKEKFGSTGHGRAALTTSHRNNTRTAKPTVTHHRSGHVTASHGNRTLTSKHRAATGFRAPTNRTVKALCISPTRITSHTTNTTSFHLIVDTPTAVLSADENLCSNDKQPCEAVGFVCFDKRRFGLCQSGCALPQTMAPGTECKDGGIGFPDGDYVEVK